MSNSKNKLVSLPFPLLFTPIETDPETPSLLVMCPQRCHRVHFFSLFTLGVGIWGQ